MFQSKIVTNFNARAWNDYEPCSKTVSTWCLDMGDNLNANGAAPVAPYVFLSFLFKIQGGSPGHTHYQVKC